MYSMVLMAALTTGGETPDFFRCGCHGGCYGCYGCCGCYGGCYGCWGCGGCWGCYGGWGYSCGGCYGACYGGWGGCYGCWGAGYGCYNACYGGGYGGGYGYTDLSPVYVPGTGTPSMGGAAPGGTGAEKLPVKPKPGTGDMKESMAPNRARLIVEVPADAKLYIDDRAMKTTSTRRAFNTPALEPGQTYYYIVKVEVVRDGKTVTESRRVLVRAGEVARATFTNLATPPVATASAK